MTTFILASLVLATLALLVLTRPYWQRPTAPPVEPPSQAMTQLREQIRQLDALRDSGALGTDAHAKARAPLERKLVAMVVDHPAPAARPTLPIGSRLNTIGLFAVFCVAITAGGYAWLGDPGALSGGPPAGQAKAAADGSDPAAHQVTPEQIADMADKLAARLQNQPDDAVGWAMLARSYAVTGQHAKAVPAFRKAAALVKDDAVLLADFADALAMTQDRSIAGEPLQLVMQALKIEPDNIKALSLAGTEAFVRKDYTTALKYWERLKQVAAADSAFVLQVQGGIDEARKLAGLPPQAAAAAAPAPSPAPSPETPAAPQAAAGKSISGTVTLSAALAGKASPEDIVFVFARAATGPRMPLAILRHQVKDLPIKFTLDDSQAMSPGTKLSLFPQVVVGARINKDGQATPQPGDLQGLSAAVAPGSNDVRIEINETVSR